jgi:hypothetical protein
MKKVKNFVSTFALLALALTSLGSVYSVAQEQKTPSKKEFIALLRTAKEPSEHRRIAEYYRHEAERLTASSKRHAAEAEVYAKHPSFAAMESKHGYAFGQTASHCRYWSKQDAEQAEKATKLAAVHEDMAKEAGQKEQ